MMITTLILWISYFMVTLFSVLCLATGLYYLAEVVEEYAVISRKLIKYSIFAVVGIHLLMFFFEVFPWMYISVGLGSHATFYLLLKEFPFIELSNPKFILSVFCVIVDHSLWFYHFTQNYMEFNEIASFFLVCVWLVPFGFFISMSANDNTLPYGIISSSGEEVTADDFTFPVGSRKRGKKTSRLMYFFNYLKKKKDQYLPNLNPAHSQKMF